jgi:hypothetical protein
MFPTIVRITVGIFSIGLLGCATKQADPAGEATTRNALSDLKLASLRVPMSLAELERTCGPAEGQPGPTVTYRSADHSGQFFWVYYFYPQDTPNAGKDATMVHHIVRADQLEQRQVVVWPPRWAGRPVTDASSDLKTLYAHSQAGREQNASADCPEPGAPV